jgi:hypothetical protein
MNQSEGILSPERELDNKKRNNRIMAKENSISKFQNSATKNKSTQQLNKYTQAICGNPHFIYKTPK